MATHADDTLLVVDDGEEVCVNLNDALHAAPADVQDRFVATLRALHPTIDYLFCGYGVASHFPNCYEIPGKDREATAARRQRHFSGQWSRIVAGLAPRFAFPFAADVALLEDDLIWANAPTHNAARPIEVFRAEHPGSATRTVDIAPGFVIEHGVVRVERVREPTTIDALRARCPEGIARANAYGSVSGEVFDEVLDRLRTNVRRCEDYLREHAGDYRFLVRFRNHDQGIAIRKTGDRIDVERADANDDAGFDVVYVTRLHYLRSSLTSPFGHEILFVGSGGIFRYARASDARRNLHRELAVVLTPHATPPRSRFGSGPRWRRLLGKAARRLLRRPAVDLYDLNAWTVWRGSGAER